MEKNFKILGIDTNATDKEITKAYYTKIKEFPPDRNPQEFIQIRKAYEKIKDPLSRAKLRIVPPDACHNFTDILAVDNINNKYVGPEAWLELLQKNKEKNDR